MFQSNKNLNEALGDGGGQCAALRQQNKRLKQIVRALTETDSGLPPPTRGVSSSENHLLFAAGPRSQRELNPAQLLLQQAVEVPSVSVTRVLVTPTPTFSTDVQTTSYQTVITTSVTTELPILVRGQKIVTTIIEPTSQTGKATTFMHLRDN